MTEQQRIDFGWNDAAVTVWAGTDNGKNCALPIMHMLASHGFKTQQVPHAVARYCVDPCTQILHVSLFEWQGDRSADRLAQLKSLRALRAERRASEGLRL